MDPDGVDLLLDEHGLWTTAPGPGRGSLRPVPGPGGVSRQRLWPIPVEADLGADAERAVSLYPLSPYSGCASSWAQRLTGGTRS